MEMNMGKFSEKLVELLELAKKKKNVLEYQEISDFFKDQPLEVEQMEKVLDFLEASGVDVLRISGNDEELILDVDDDADIEKMDDEEEIEEMVVQSAETSSNEVITVQEVVAVQEEVEEVVPFAVIEVKPVYPGCERFKDKQDRLEKCISQKLNEFLQREVVYPQIALEMGISGKVILKLTIGKDGKTRAEVARGVDKNLDNEALRAVSKLKNWTPGMQRNKPVEVSYFLPVNFTAPR